MHCARDSEHVNQAVEESVDQCRTSLSASSVTQRTYSGHSVPQSLLPDVPQELHEESQNNNEACEAKRTTNDIDSTEPAHLPHVLL